VQLANAGTDAAHRHGCMCPQVTRQEALQISGNVTTNAPFGWLTKCLIAQKGHVQTCERYSAEVRTAEWVPPAEAPNP
jgi:hypothetical protein